jgi:NaMN:DMB phosphoribosyltransferase
MNFICIIKTNKMAKKKIKKVVKKVKENIDENRSLYNKILCYGKCYGGYLLAVGAGCSFGANIWWGLGLLAAAGGWAYWATHCNSKANCKR